MNHGMAIGTHGSQIGYRINLPLGPRFRQRLKMVNMHEPPGLWPINRLKVHVTDLADGPVTFKTSGTGLGIAFVGVDLHPIARAFQKRVRNLRFARKQENA